MKALFDSPSVCLAQSLFEYFPYLVAVTIWLIILVVVMILIWDFVDWILKIQSAMQPKPPETALDTLEARVLRQIRETKPDWCCCTYGDLENQPIFESYPFAQIVAEAAFDLRDIDNSNGGRAASVFKRSISRINGLLAYETQRVQPVVQSYLAEAKRKGVQAADVIDHRG